jgi:uncharacterized coiled-coil DUF342 family protein
MLKKDLHYYSKRLLKQMLKVDNVRAKIDYYFMDSYQKCTNLEFTEDALKAFQGTQGLSVEMNQELNKVIDTMYAFVKRWENSRNVDKKTIKFARRLYNELVQLSSYITDTPQDMMADATNYIMRERL